jgi:hypothetical protein
MLREKVSTTTSLDTVNYKRTPLTHLNTSDMATELSMSMSTTSSTNMEPTSSLPRDQHRAQMDGSERVTMVPSHSSDISMVPSHKSHLSMVPSHRTDLPVAPGHAKNFSLKFPNTKEPSPVSTTTVPVMVTDTITEHCKARAPAPHSGGITTMRLCEECYQELSLPLPRVTNISAQATATADSGAQMTAAGMNLANALGITRRKLIPLATKLNAAGSNALGLIGGMLVTITEMIFAFFLSNQASSGTRTYSCPARSSPPPTPTFLPPPVATENREKLEAWTEEHYSPSTFNHCQHP